MKLVNNKKGFTLVELLLVMAIIGILAGVIFIMIGPARKKGRTTAFKQAMKGLVSSATLCTDAGGTISTVNNHAFCSGATAPNLGNFTSLPDCDGTGVATVNAAPNSGDSWQLTGICNTPNGQRCNATCNVNGCTFTGDCN